MLIMTTPPSNTHKPHNCANFHSISKSKNVTTAFNCGDDLKEEKTGNLLSNIGYHSTHVLQTPPS